MESQSLICNGNHHICSMIEKLHFKETCSLRYVIHRHRDLFIKKFIFANLRVSFEIYLLFISCIIELQLNIFINSFFCDIIFLTFTKIIDTTLQVVIVNLVINLMLQFYKNVSFGTFEHLPMDCCFWSSYRRLVLVMICNGTSLSPAKQSIGNSVFTYCVFGNHYNTNSFFKFVTFCAYEHRLIQNNSSRNGDNETCYHTLAYSMCQSSSSSWFSFH